MTDHDENETTTDEKNSEYRQNLKADLAIERAEGVNHWKNREPWEDFESTLLSDEEGDLWAEHLEDAFDGDVWFAILALREALLEQRQKILELRLALSQQKNGVKADE